MTEQAQPCHVGRSSENPCPHPAVSTMMYDRLPVCEGHRVLYELVAPKEDQLGTALEYLKRWIRTADRSPFGEPLQERLRAMRDEFAAELADLKDKEREIEERYSLPPSGLEQLKAKKRGEEAAPASLPEAEADRRWQELDARSCRLIAAADELEAELDRFHVRREDSVLPLLEQEVDKANEEAHRVKEEFGL